MTAQAERGKRSSILQPPTPLAQLTPPAPGDGATLLDARRRRTHGAAAMHTARISVKTGAGSRLVGALARSGKSRRLFVPPCSITTPSALVHLVGLVLTSHAPPAPPVVSHEADSLCGLMGHASRNGKCSCQGRVPPLTRHETERVIQAPFALRLLPLPPWPTYRAHQHTRLLRTGNSNSHIDHNRSAAPATVTATTLVDSKHQVCFSSMYLPAHSLQHQRGPAHS